MSALHRPNLRKPSWRQVLQNAPRGEPLDLERSAEPLRKIEWLRIHDIAVAPLLLINPWDQPS